MVLHKLLQRLAPPIRFIKLMEALTVFLLLIHGYIVSRGRSSCCQVDGLQQSMSNKRRNEISRRKVLVKLIVNLTGRENEFKNNAIDLIRRFCDDVGEIEEIKNFRDRNMTLVLVPNKVVLQQKETPKKKEKSTGTEVSVTASVSP
ncbi:unnamed protein product [Lactuca virosa]|uniref:Uncharacterized protein n=1 Tax=Lactuca virosa TaxID=75947 RepID=A0AAU9P792_9ASTR|nr:unnamed protein product [Lactuca virosa]